jgi:peptidoglycan hydrolase-like protein with peptidoglycan-binding domain
MRHGPNAAPAIGLSNQAVQRSLQADIVPRALVAINRQALGSQTIQRLARSQAQPGTAVEAVQRREATATTAPAPAADEANFFGLKRGDGITSSTNRPRVKKLQERLDSRMGSDLKVDGEYDGKFGQNTERVLKDFQGSVGLEPVGFVGPKTNAALMASPSPQPGPLPGPVPPGPLPGPVPPVPPEPTPVNPLLEDALQNVWLQYQLNFQAMSRVLDRLEKDLDKREGPSHKAAELLKEAALKTFFGMFAAGLAENFGAIIFHAVESSEETKKLIEEMFVKPIAEGLTAPAEKVIEEAAAEESQDKLSSEQEQLSAFIDMQQKALTEQEGTKQEIFLTKGKREARSLEGKRDPSSGRDLAFAYAEGIENALKQSRQPAADALYDKALAAWAGLTATKALGTTATGPIDPSTGKPKEELNLGRKGFDTPGVLEIEVEGPAPAEPVKLKGATITGLSKAARNKLAKHQAAHSIESLGLPRVVHGAVGPGEVTGSIDIGRFGSVDTGKTFERNSDRGGVKWLKVKHAVANPGAKGDPLAGAAVVLNEVDNKKVSDIPGGIQGP